MINAHFAAALGPMRAPFLLLVPVCVLLGWAAAVHDGHSVNAVHLALAAAGALAAHISVNALNEYEDFRSGLDFRTERTPFSGGTGVLPANPDKAHYALVVAVATLCIVIAVGVYFIRLRGVGILPLGLAGVLIIVLYTRWLTRSPLLCLLAPGVGFGPLMVLGVYYVLTGVYSTTALMVSLLPLFMVSDLLLINQFPDREADRWAGRNHLLLVWGGPAGVAVYGVFLFAAYVSVVVAVIFKVLPPMGLLSLATIPVAALAYRGLRRHQDSVPALVPHMAQHVALTLATPLLLALGIAIS
ncbi:prenyltransferase [Chromatocurvus halotolerans]|uniref:1,4-dihydroxy-2-naphthoate octaprenyltransferase n=1 Tax=Chromatocurvus halotolerans TaxID=1132028 RepID=A0A4R2KT51_9GAMM|nr:prenyltransferase [Chromatocurvus halotolerans]TCO77561.1 1,4-dihydroxy-2-naphthoate octaprenyltransferase [Chromatocurvus halotolerans]